MRKTKAVVLVLILVFSASLYAQSGYPLDQNNVNAFDRLTMQSYSKGLDMAADVTSIAAMLAPAALLSVPTSDYLTVGVMYVETLALSYGTNELIKYLVFRERPYLYFDGYPEDEVASGDCNKSFPSRHTTMAFAAAAFNTYVFSTYYPDSKWKIPVVALSYSLAAATAGLRIASGNHFMTDVLAGALIGTAIGYGIPALHTLFADKDVEASVSPFGLVFSVAF